MVKIILVEIVLLLIKLAIAIGLLALVAFVGYCLVNCLVNLYLAVGAVSFVIGLLLFIGLSAFIIAWLYCVFNLP